MRWHVSCFSRPRGAPDTGLPFPTEEMTMVATNVSPQSPAMRGAGLDYESRSLVLESLKEFGRRELPG